MFFCPICVPKKNLRTKNEYVKHFDATHFTKSRQVYPCPECQIGFKNRTSFYKHVKIHDFHVEEDGSSKQNLCRHCSQSFSSTKLLEDHLKTIQDNIPCPYCRKSIPNYGAFRTHKYRYLLFIILKLHM